MKKYLFLTAILVAITSFAQNFAGGQEIFKNVKTYSPSQEYYLIFQQDGNLVMYKARNNSSFWSSKTSNLGSRAIFQDDGNLVVYNRSNTPVFSTNTGNRGAMMRVQDDGNLVIYSRNSNPIWSSVADTAQNGGESPHFSQSGMRKGFKFSIGEKLYSNNREFYLSFQPDGNLVIYDRNRNVVWDAKTGNRGARAEFQNDGNLVVYNRRGQALFASNTGNRNANSLLMQDDGNLVIYDSRNNPLWSSDGEQ